MKSGLGAGLGIGIPVILASGAALFFTMRNRRPRPVQAVYQTNSIDVMAELSGPRGIHELSDTHVTPELPGSHAIAELPYPHA